MGEVSVLVNAVEEFDTEKGLVHETSDERILALLNLNTLPMVYMCRFLGPQLKQRIVDGKAKGSAVINMTSYYKEFKAFNMPLYCAGKSFQDGIS